MKQIFYHGTILTMKNQQEVDAICVENGVIVKVGKEKDVFTLQDEKTELIDLKGKCMMPSFLDAHSHITSYAQALGIVNLSGAKNFSDIVSLLTTYYQENPNEEVVVGYAYDHNFLEEKKHPTKELLDQIATDIPVMISHASGHMGVVNSKALSLLNITDEVENPEGGLIGKENGKVTGYLEEQCFMQSQRLIKEKTIDQKLMLLQKAIERYLQYGITTIQEGIVKEPEWKLLKEAAERNLLPIDIVGYVDIKQAPDLFLQHSAYRTYQNRFRLGGYKLFLDGSPQGKTAWLTEPYLNSGTYCGYPIYQNEEVYHFVKKAYEEQCQLLTHCNGDAAADQLLATYERLERETKAKEFYRPVMIHAQTVRMDQLERMKKIGMIPSFFVAHTYYWGDVHLHNLGSERARKISPSQSAIQCGLPFTFHQDTPVIEPNMLETVWCAVNRMTKKGIDLKEEKISVYQALEAVTKHVAYQYFEEDQKGTIELGKIADLVVLSANPLEVAKEKIKDIVVERTYKEGRLVYQR